VFELSRCAFDSVPTGRWCVGEVSLVVWLRLPVSKSVFPKEGATIPDVGGRTSKGEAAPQRCLMPLEIPEIEGHRTVRRSTRDLDIPGKQYPRALGQLGIYCWTHKKAVAREAVETQSVVAAKMSSFGPNEKIRANLRMSAVATPIVACRNHIPVTRERATSGR
jgi:hypothetical protein